MEKKDCNICVGRFQPLTLGHISILKALKKENGYPTVICNISNTKFDAKHPFSDDLIKKEIETCLKDEDYYLDCMFVKNAAIDIIGSNLKEKGYVAHLWGCGTDREKAYRGMIKNKKYLVDFPDDFDLFVVKRDETSSDVDGISATKVREAIKSDDKAAFVKMMPDGAQKLYDDFKEAMSQVKESHIGLGEYVNNENYLDIE